MKLAKTLTLLFTTATLALGAAALCSAQRRGARSDARRRASAARSDVGRTKEAGRTKSVPALDPAKLTEGQKRLVAQSRATILQTGMTSSYFDEHFKLTAVSDEANNRHVEWLYSINGYEASVSDPIGYYTDADGRRIDIHGVRDALVRTRDLAGTIPRARALQIMRSCIGPHGAATVVFKSLELNNPARLYLVARELKEGKDPVSESAAGERRRGRERVGGEEEEGMTLFDVGFVDLESGQCKVVAGGVTG